MMVLVMKYLLPIKIIAGLAAAAFVYWFVWDTGRAFERGRWEKATAVEMARQADVLDAAQRASEVAAGLLLAAENRRIDLVRRLSNEALQDTGASDACISPAGVLRLNTLSGEAETD